MESEIEAVAYGAGVLDIFVPLPFYIMRQPPKPPTLPDSLLNNACICSEQQGVPLNGDTIVFCRAGSRADSFGLLRFRGLLSPLPVERTLAVGPTRCHLGAILFSTMVGERA